MSFRNYWSRAHGYYQRRAASLVFRRPFVISSPRPLISFTFDDFPRSALLSGGAILSRFGLAGTYYAAFSLIGKKTTPSGPIFSLEDLTTLFDQGHELGCHTFSHSDSWKTSSREFERSILKNRAALSELCPSAEFYSFSYPISLPRPLSKARTARYFLSSRGGGQTINVGTVDPNQLSAYFFRERVGDNLQTIKDLIDHNRQGSRLADLCYSRRL